MTFVKYNQGHQVLQERGMCPGCDEGWRLLHLDARHPSNLEKARELKPRIKRYVSGHPGCTADDIYGDLQCYDIPMYIALHWLVEDSQLKGPDPYACGAGRHHTDWEYRVMRPVNQMEFAATR